ncbi:MULTISPECIES: DoxX family protein [unclassified Chryseobacterium]|uniref:DoxX family protein n=1 Tax=unclassified Chryseobacterium TaxID=2593645 RepID=UPI000D34A300|nr:MULTISPECIES: MauE/DoxX family redox-associated membrane protein [unclassified Chryseobacterium]PTT77177.1 tellurium resistance protein TerC [Chryseobacterium sp. HMWF001]PVV61811.1 tellurium resistance protein TerC [Chryseobacterium sp. HMWF035]
MKKKLTQLPIWIAYFFILLYCYAAISKVFDFENFQVQIAQSPLLSAYAGFVSYAVIIVELLIVPALIFTTTKRAGLYASLGIMVAFTVYIFLILNYSEFIPCSCGGILEKMGWIEHLIFNIICVLLAIAAIIITEKENKRRPTNYITLIISVIIANMGIVTYLFFSSEQIMKKENNFTRRFMMHPTLEQKSLQLSDSHYYFAGSDDGNIYLGNRKFPQTLLIVDTALTNQESMRTNLDNMKHPFRNLKLTVKAPYYYIHDGTVPVIFRGKLGNPNARTISLQDAYFNQLIVLDSLRFALRTQSSETRQFVLADLNLNTGHKKLQLHSDILQKQIDGVFDIDGSFIADNRRSQLVYTYTYRNQFIVMDADLNVQKKMNTIDTVRLAKIESKRLTDGIHKMSAPPLKVNLRSAVHKNLLFNQSDLMGKHESKKAWKEASIIDVYRTDKPEYVGSFYLFKKDNKSVSDFMVTDKYLYAIIGDKIIQYQFTKPITKYFTSGEAENRSKE